MWYDPGFEMGAILMEVRTGWIEKGGCIFSSIWTENNYLRDKG